LANARAARLAGDYAQAQSHAEAVLAAEPRNADAWVELGLTHAAAGAPDEARSAFERALSIAPNYDDARIGLARLAFNEGDGAGARSWLASVSETRARDPEVVAVRQALEAGERAQWRIDIAAAYSTLSADLEPWREAAISATRRNGVHTLGIGIDVAERFGESDVYGEVRFAQATSYGHWAVALGGADEPLFKPEAALRFSIATDEEQAWALDAALTFARYDVGQVNQLTVRPTRRFGIDIRVHAAGIFVLDETDDFRAGYAVGGAWRARDRVEISLTWADAPESSEGATIDVRSLAFGLALDVAPDTRIRLGVAREERAAFDRTEFSLALARTF
jgi:YaiO family outer membrane protein